MVVGAARRLLGRAQALGQGSDSRRIVWSGVKLPGRDQAAADRQLPEVLDDLPAGGADDVGDRLSELGVDLLFDGPLQRRREEEIGVGGAFVAEDRAKPVQDASQLRKQIAGQRDVGERLTVGGQLSLQTRKEASVLDLNRQLDFLRCCQETG